jgi:hypothetical protein
MAGSNNALELNDAANGNLTEREAAALAAHGRFHDDLRGLSVSRAGYTAEPIPNAVPGEARATLLPNAVPGDSQIVPIPLARAGNETTPPGFTWQPVSADASMTGNGMPTTGMDGSYQPQTAGQGTGDGGAGGGKSLSMQDAQMLMQMWASLNGLDPMKPDSYAQLNAGADGRSMAVGPYKLDANAIGNWMGTFVNQSGQFDPNLLNSVVQSGEISPQTAQIITSPQFAQFVGALAQGPVWS